MTESESESYGEPDALLEPSVEITPPPKRHLLRWSLTVTLLYFAQTLSNYVFKNQIVYQTCTAVYHYNETICKVLGTAESDGDTELQRIEEEVQPYAANIFMARTLLEAIIPSIVSLFFGPWSDKFGRKPVLIIISLGFLISYSLITVFSMLSTFLLINPWIYIVLLIPSGLGGGISTLLSVSYAYFVDLSSVEERAFKIGLVGANIAVGLVLGTFVSGYLYTATNEVTIYGVSAAAILIALIHTIFVVEESVKQEDIQRSRIRGFFKLELIVDVFRTCCQKVPGNNRIMVWCSMVTLCFIAFVQDGSGTVFYLFLRQKFSMTVSDCTIYETISLIAVIGGAMLGIGILQIYLKLSPISLALISLGSATLDSIIKATASYRWHLYLAIGFSALKGITGPMCQAILSNSVPDNDIGKIYSLTTALTSIVPLGAAPLYTYIYNISLITYPGAINALSTGLYLLAYLLMMMVFATEIRTRPSDSS